MKNLSSFGGRSRIPIAIGAISALAMRTLAVSLKGNTSQASIVTK